MPERAELLAELDRALRAMDRPVTREQVVETASQMLKPVDQAAYAQFTQWFDKNDKQLLGILNG